MRLPQLTGAADGLEGHVAGVGEAEEVAHEAGKVAEIFAAPAHPYTRSLMLSVPVLGRRARFGRQKLREIPGTVPDPAHLPAGCAFCNRCDLVQEICHTVPPNLATDTSGRTVRCHFPLTGDVENTGKCHEYS